MARPSKKKHHPTTLWKRAWSDCLAILRPIQLFDYCVPRWINHRLSEWVGGYLIFGLMSRTRRKLKYHLELIGKGQWKQRQIRKMARETIQNYGKYLIDYLYFPQLNAENIKQLIGSVEGQHHLEELILQKQGIILLSPHLGHWELGGISLALQGYPLTVISLMTGDRQISEYRDQIRMRNGIRVIYQNPKEPLNSALEFVQVLRRGEILAMLGDRNTGNDSISLPFFQKPYLFPAGPYLLALIAQAPILPAFVVLEGLQYKLIIEAPFKVERQVGKTREEVLKVAAQKMADLFEYYIRKYPTQWYNWYPSWASPSK